MNNQNNQLTKNQRKITGNGNLVPFKKNDPKIYRGGRKPITFEEKIIKKEVKKWLLEYEASFLKALPSISPVVIYKAKEGNMQAISEIHKVIGAYKSNDFIPPQQQNLQINIINQIDKIYQLNDKE